MHGIWKNCNLLEGCCLIMDADVFEKYMMQLIKELQIQNGLKLLELRNEGVEEENICEMIEDVTK